MSHVLEALGEAPEDGRADAPEVSDPTAHPPRRT